MPQHREGAANQTSGFELIRISDDLVVFRLYGREETCLDEANLRARIANLSKEAPHLDLSPEEAALAELVARRGSAR